jgi:hypothetical protein
MNPRLTRSSSLQVHKLMPLEKMSSGRKTPSFIWALFFSTKPADGNLLDKTCGSFESSDDKIIPIANLGATIMT